MFSYILFSMGAVFCFWLCIKVVRGEGLVAKIQNLYLCYKIEDKKIKFKMFLGLFCVRAINISDINQISLFQKLKGKTEIFLDAEHWERRFLQIVAINVKSGKGNRWLLLSPENVDKFIEEVEKQKTA